MKKNRVVMLVEALTLKERDVLAALLKKHVRQSIYKLFKYIAEKINDGQIEKITKKDAFYAIYKTPYIAQKDYLLRNDFRLLSSEINTFLQAVVAENVQWNQNCEYLSLLLNRRKFNLFEKEYIALSKQVAKLPKHNTKKLQLQNMWIGYLMLLNIENEEKIKDTISEISNFLNLQKANYAGKIAETLVKHARMEAVLRKIATKTSISKKQTNAFNLESVLVDKQANYANYQLLKAKSYALKGYIKIQVLEELIEKATHGVFDNKQALQKEKIILLSSIAVEHYLLRQNDKAVTFFEKAVAIQGFETFVKRWDVLYNYISALLRNGNYTKAIQILKTIPEEIPDKAILYKFEIMRALAAIFAEEYAQAGRILLTLEKSASKHDYLYLRILFIILNICKNDYDNAIREAQNILQLAIIKRQDMSNYKTIIKFLLSYLQAEHLPKSKKQQKIKKLYKEIKEMMQAPAKMQLDMIPLQLVEKQIKTELYPQLVL